MWALRLKVTLLRAIEGRAKERLHHACRIYEEAKMGDNQPHYQFERS